MGNDAVAVGLMIVGFLVAFMFPLYLLAALFY
jgi:hypothetical protein